MKQCLKIDENIIIRIVDMPLTVEGVTVTSNDDCYNIYLNANYNIDMQRKTLMHELKHIKNYDFDNFDSIELCELRADETSE